MAVVTANDLKTKGISDIERLLQSQQEVVISVRGKSRYVVMDIAHYDFLAGVRAFGCVAANAGGCGGRTRAPRKRRRTHRPSARVSSPMSYSLVFTEHYERMERRFVRTHPDLLDRYHKTLALLEQDPFHPSLRLHPLGGRLAGLHAVSINLQYRITLELELREQEVILVGVGSHGEVY